MPTKIHDPARSGGFAWANDITDADVECGHQRSPVKTHCPVCRRALMLHCDLCRIQVTGCLCTLVERMGPGNAYRTLAEQVGQRKAQEVFKSFGYNMPWRIDLPE